MVSRSIFLLVLFLSSLYGAPNDDAQRYLTERVSVWQKRLNLEAWNVSIEVVPRAALRPGTIGNVKWEPKAKTACIRVMQSADYDRSPEEALEDMEFTVIHELVHLQKDGGAEDEVDAVVYSLLLAKDDGQLSHQQGH